MDMNLLETELMGMILPLYIALLAVGLVALLLERMNRRRGMRVVAAVVAVALIGGVNVTPALAAESVWNSSSATPAFATGTADTQTRGSVSFTLGNDLLWMGESAVWTEIQAPNDILAAGQSMTLRDVTTAGSVRLAGQSLYVAGSTVGQSLTLAGQEVYVSGGSCTSAALAGQTVSFAGETNDLYIAGQTVYLDGVIHGNVHAEASDLVICSNAVVEGTLFASVSSIETMDGAQVGLAEVEYVERETVDVSGLMYGMSWVYAVLSVLSVFVLALLAEWLTRRQTVQSAAMVKVRTAPMLVSGLVGALVAPFVLVLLMCTIVGIPAAMALIFLLLGLQLVAAGFAAASLAKVAFPHMGRFQGTLLMGLIVGVLSAVPVLGAVVDVAAFMYTLGYVLQRIYLGMRSGVMPEPPASTETDATIAADTPL